MSTNQKWLASDKEYVEAANKLHALKAELADKQRQADKLAKALETEAKQNPIDREARELLGDDEPKGEADQVEALRHDIRVLNRAIALQVDRVGRERARASQAVAAKQLPAHKANVKKLAEALEQLRQAAKAEHKLRDELFAADVSYGAVIRPMPFHGRFTNAEELSDVIDAWLKEAKEFGLV